MPICGPLGAALHSPGRLPRRTHLSRALAAACWAIRPETELDVTRGGRQEELPDDVVEVHLGMTQAGAGLRSRAPHHDWGEAVSVMQGRPGLF